MSGMPDGPAAADGGSEEFGGALTQVLEAIGGCDLATVDAVAVMMGQAAGIVDSLAAELAAIQAGLDAEAHTASRYGVTIGTDGQPPPLPDGAPAAAASVRHWALAYRHAFELAGIQARQARLRAARQLTDLCATIDQRHVLAASASVAGRDDSYWPNGAGGSSEGSSRNEMNAAGRSAEAKMS